jgi:hypothetical protein
MQRVAPRMIFVHQHSVCYQGAWFSSAQHCSALLCSALLGAVALHFPLPCQTDNFAGGKEGLCLTVPVRDCCPCGHTDMLHPASPACLLANAGRECYEQFVMSILSIRFIFNRDPADVSSQHCGTIARDSVMLAQLGLVCCKDHRICRHHCEDSSPS